ncbi:two-partner secretion domain-containing protein [Thalassospira sp. CH_XMU1458]|uniref:two-partner secretion domain-containing protein n=1 Tax=Thalassospira sp. CH_XMU1458 TaxID=3107776 RepID=UPI00300C691F
MLKSFATQILSVTLSAVIVVQPVMAQVVVDNQAAANNQASLDAARNGVPIVNIANPNGAGISHNKFKDFNVGVEGLILNNSRTVGQSQLGGVIAGNANLTSGSARLILNEVTGASRSNLLGYQEIFGQSAEYVLANPSGITCNGCGFINTPRATFSTGLPQFDSSGDFLGVDVDTGDVLIDGAGLNAANVPYFDIISRTAKINADLHARDLSIITGRNTVNYVSREAVAKSDIPEKPNISIDSSLLGGMYANRIRLVGTEQGVGVKVAGDLAASSGELTISADGKISVNNLTSAQNISVASAADSVTVTGTVQASQTTQIKADNAIEVQSQASVSGDHLQIETARLENQGKIKGGQQTNIETNHTENTGTIIGNGGVSVVSDTLNNLGSGLIKSDADIIIQTDLTNEGGLEAEGKLDVASTNNLVVGGRLVGGGGLRLSAANDLTVDSEEVYSAGPAELTVGGQLINNGKLSIAGDLGGTIKTLVNNGEIQVSENLALSVTSDFENRDIVFAAGDLSFLVGDTLFNNQGTLIAGGDIELVGLDDGNMALLDNASATIESLEGDIRIKTDELLNRKVAFSTSSQRTFQQRYAANQTTHPGCNTVPGAGISPEGCAYFPGSGVAHVPHPWKSNYTSYYSTESSSNGILVEVYQDVVSQDSPESVISSGRDLFVTGGTISNDKSQIQAGRDIELTGTSLANVGAQITRRLYHTASASNGFTRCYGGPCKWFEFTNARKLVESDIIDSHDAQIVAGGTFSGSFTGQVNNTTIVQGAVSLPSDGISYVDELVNSIPDPANIPVTTVPNGGVYVPPTPGLFTEAPEDRNYVYETRFEHTDFGTFYGSDYFFDQIGFDQSVVEDLPKRLGDAFFDTRLVREQVIAQTGQRFLNTAENDAAQMRQLIEAAAAQKQGLGLSVGTALSADQIAALTESIVWYVEEEVNGQTVLVPKLYLAGGDKADITAEGAIIAAADVNILADSIANSGKITATDDMSLTALGSIINAGGTINAGNDLRLVAATGDVINMSATDRLTGSLGYQDMLLSSGKIAAGNSLSIEAGRDILNEGADISAGGDATFDAGGDVAFTATEISRNVDYEVPGFSLEQRSTHNQGSNVDIGGNLAIKSGDNITVAGSQISAGGNLDLEADGNIQVVALQDYEYQHSERRKSSSFNSGTREALTSVISSLQAGGALNVVSKDGDVLIKASKLSSGEQTTLSAEEGQVALLSNTDSLYEHKIRESSNFAWFSNRDTGHIDETVVMTEITADGGLIVNAGNGVVIEYRDTGNLEESVTALAATPGLEWMGEMMARDDATWHAVQEVHRSWDYKAEGLSGAGAAVIAIAVTAISMGTGAGAALGAMAAQGMGAGAVASGVVTAAVSAGFTALASTAAISLINNKGDLGAVLKELGSSATLRSLATSMVTAGLTAGIAAELGIDVGKTAEISDQIAYQSIRALTNTVANAAINGTDIGDTLKSNLISAVASIASAQLATKIGDLAGVDQWNLDEGDIRKVVMHAIAGCGVGQLSSQNCAAGAIGAGLQEVLGDSLENISDDINTRIQLAGLAGAIAVALTGGDADAVNTASFTAQQAATYNRQLHTEERVAIRKLAEELAEEGEFTADEWESRLGRAAARNVDATYAEMFAADDEASAILANHFKDQTFTDEYGRQVTFLDPDNAFFNRARYADHILPNADFYEAVLAPSYPDNAVPAAFRALTEAAFDPDLGSEPAKAQQDVLNGLTYISEQTTVQLDELQQAIFSGEFRGDDLRYALQILDDFTQYQNSVDGLVKTVRAQGVRAGVVEPDYIENIKDIASVAAVLAGSATRLTSLASVRAKINKNWSSGGPNGTNKGLPDNGIDYSAISTASNGQRVSPTNLQEQSLWTGVVENPAAGRVLQNLNNDPRFQASDGFQKMEMTTVSETGQRVTIHYQYNSNTGQPYDIKIVYPLGG